MQTVDANSKLKDTPKGVSSSFAENNGTVTNKNGDVVAVDSNGTAQFNIRTFEDGGREYLERYLVKQSDIGYCITVIKRKKNPIYLCRPPQSIASSTTPNQPILLYLGRFIKIVNKTMLM